MEFLLLFYYCDCLSCSSNIISFMFFLCFAHYPTHPPAIVLIHCPLAGRPIVRQTKKQRSFVPQHHSTTLTHTQHQTSSQSVQVGKQFQSSPGRNFSYPGCCRRIERGIWKCAGFHVVFSFPFSYQPTGAMRCCFNSKQPTTMLFFVGGKAGHSPFDDWLSIRISYGSITGYCEAACVCVLIELPIMERPLVVERNRPFF